MNEKDAVYKTKLAAELFQIGRQYQTGSYGRLYDGEYYQLFLEPDIWFALQCFRHAVSLDPNQEYIDRYIPLYILYNYAHIFNGPLLKPEYQNMFNDLCKSELAKFKGCSSEIVLIILEERIIDLDNNFRMLAQLTQARQNKTDEAI
jgi:hypothetical protein